MTAGATRRQWLLAGGVGAVAAAAGLGGALWREQSGAAGGVEAAVPGFWDLTFPQPGGGELRLASLRGRPWLLNFWATWCPPCVREMPALDRFHRAQPAGGWQVVGLAVDGPTPVREFLQRQPVAYPVGLAGLDGAQLTRQLGNATGGLPFTAVIDAAGRLRHRHLGEASEADMQRWAVEYT